MNRNGAELIVEALKQEGVTLVFGYPGGAVIPLFDVLYSEKDIRVVLTRHEQAAVHAADGYARSTGKTGVCIVTSGPGATNTITGLATANFDSVPIVCIAGQVPRNMIGNDAFQEADTSGLTRPVTKHNYLITERRDTGPILKRSFYIAGSGRPGPVVVDVPKDIFTATEDDEYPEEIVIRGYSPGPVVGAEKFEKVVSLLDDAEKPVFFIGGGLHISDSQDIFRKTVEKTGIPVVSSLMGIGILPHDSPYYCGMIGMHGSYAANSAVSECDLLVSIGARFDDRATGDLSKFAPHAKIIHIDIDPASIAKNVPVELSIVSDATYALETLYPLFKTGAAGKWIETVTKWKNENHPRRGPVSSRESLSPLDVINGINAVFPDAIISTEVGQNQMWAAMYYHFQRSRTWLTSGGLGTMGYGFPAAIGAQLGNPDKRVIDIAGDGSIQMNIQELATAVQEELPVIIAILNNGYLGMVRQWQEFFYDRRYSSTCLKKSRNCPEECDGSGEHCPPYRPDFVKLAEAYGAEGIRVTAKESIEDALRTAKNITRCPIIIDFIIERESNVFPMVPPGAGIQEMLL